MVPKPSASEPGPVLPSRTGDAARARTWVREHAQRASGWAVGARTTHRSVDVGFRLADRDKRVAAGVLAGGVAYRMFFWVLSVSVLTTGAFGFMDGSRLDEALSAMGIGPVGVGMVHDLVAGTEEARWWLIVVGGSLVLWTGYLGAKAQILVHAAVWRVLAPPATRPLAMSLIFSGTALAFVASMAIADKVHAEGEPLSVIADLAVTAITFGVWLMVSRVLPHRGGGWKDLVPGAVLLGIGAQAVYQFTTLLLTPKLANATQLYGLLGVTATALFWFYIVGRLMIGAATLNAALHEQRSTTAAHLVP